MTSERNTVPQADRWNVEAMYPSINEWEKDFSTLFKENHPRWPELAQFQGRLSESPETLKKAMDLLFAIDRKLSNAYTYAHLRHDEEITDDNNKTAFKKVTGIIHDFHAESAWFQPELMSFPQNLMNQFLSSPVLAEYRFYLERIFRLRPHILPADQEALMALSGKALQSTHKAFSAINDADFKFGTVLDSEGKEKELTHATYGLYIHGQDRTLRKNAFDKVLGTYESYENTLCELLQGQIQAHLFNARARKYQTCLDAALFPNQIDTSVYRSLIETVNKNLPVLHKYVALRQMHLSGIDQVHMYDMYVPLTPSFDMKLSYAEAENLVIESVAPLGREYQETLRKGFKDDRWVDRYENKNKRSGAYSSGCYDSMPYILMNYKERLRDLFTLAHEAGHSMHSYLSHKNQPYHYGDYSIFLAEVASTFNEELLMNLMLKNAKSDEEKIYLITQKIEDIRSTLFRQTMFAEFELLLHTMAENNIPFTPKILREAYLKLNRNYFGNLLVIDPVLEIEWARIPHFYYNYYVFQYATGISAALALATKVLNGGEQERNAYLSFLKGGSSRYPIEMLKLAGIDMRSPAPVQAAIDRFSALLNQLEELLKKKS